MKVDHIIEEKETFFRFYYPPIMLLYSPDANFIWFLSMPESVLMYKLIIKKWKLTDLDILKYFEDNRGRIHSKTFNI